MRTKKLRATRKGGEIIQNLGLWLLVPLCESTKVGATFSTCHGHGVSRRISEVSMRSIPGDRQARGSGYQVQEAQACRPPIQQQIEVIHNIRAH